MSGQKRDSIEWCEMMIEHSPLTDCKPMFAQIAEELRQLRAVTAATERAAPAMAVVAKSAGFFLKMWNYFTDGSAFDGEDLQVALEQSGLAEWRDATAEEMERAGLDAEPGSLLFLNDDGKTLLAAAKVKT